MRTKHLSPFPQGKNLRFPDRPDVIFALYTGQWKFVSCRLIVSAKENVPDRKEGDKILVTMLWKVAVMYPMALGTRKENGRSPELQPQIAVILKIQERPGSDYRSLNEPGAKKVRGVKFEQCCDGN